MQHEEIEDEELLDDVLDEVLSDDDDEDDDALEPRGAVHVDMNVAMHNQMQRRNEPIGVVIAQESAMDVDVHLPNNNNNRPAEVHPQQPNDPNARASEIDNEPPIEGYARYVLPCTSF